MIAEVTPQEAQIANRLGEVWNSYLGLPVEHPMERDEFCRAVHTLQDMVLARAGRRAVNQPEGAR